MQEKKSLLIFILSEKAINDLEEIWTYTFKNWSKEQADFYYLTLIQSFHYSVKNPNSKNINISPISSYFKLKINSHIVYFKIR